MRLIRLVSALFLLLILLVSCRQEESALNSPDGNIMVIIYGPQQDEDGGIYYNVFYKGEEMIGRSALGLEFRNMPDLYQGLRRTGSERRVESSNWERVWGRNKKVRDHYKELTINLTSSEHNQRMAVIFRVYDDGVAIRYHVEGAKDGQEFELVADHTEFNLLDNNRVWAAHYGSFHAHQESEFNEMFLDDPRMQEVTGMPLLVQAGHERWVAITEANLTNWAGMYVRATKNNHVLETVLAPWPDDPELLVKSETPRHSPWRVIMMGDSPGRFLENDIIANLNEPQAIDDVSWIEPGISAWDWWWCNRYGPEVDFELGPNTETMKHFIDLAAEMGWEYQLVDWNWYGPPFVEGSNNPHPTSDISTMNPDIDIPELVRYGAERGVKILLWLEWNHADRQMNEAFPLYEKWGVAGVKVDFMARDDQYVVNFYHRLVKKAAEHRLVVDFHGAYKPTGVSRTWPNLMTREGIMGNEYVKWSDRITPEHKVTIPFTRGILGEMDFTPGAFVNVTMDEFKTEDQAPSPMTMGTRCNELAMMVVYESPLQVLCDAPYNYRNSPAGTDFLKIVPTTWDETIVLNAAVGDFITIARRSGEEWFIGSMTDEEARTLDIPLDFLGDGSYQADLWADAENADTDPNMLKKDKLSLNGETVLQAAMAPAGGHVVHIYPR